MPPHGEVATDLEEEEVEEEEEEETSKTATVKERKRFHEDNVYLFSDEEAAVEHIKAGNIEYEDGSSVKGMRVHKMVKDKTDTEEGTTTHFVIARNKSIACEIWCSLVHSVQALLARPLRAGGRGRYKILSEPLQFGKIVASQVFPKGDIGQPKLADATKIALEGWKLWEEGGPYAHYITQERTWKEVN